jgi:hypothetical protein
VLVEDVEKLFVLRSAVDGFTGKDKEKDLIEWIEKFRAHCGVVDQ